MSKSTKTTFSTYKEIKALKPKSKEYTLTDYYTKGLQLLIRTDGGKQWVFRYSSPILKDKHNKAKRRRTGFGSYPTVSLDMARKRANKFKEEISQGIDPLEIKQEVKMQTALEDKSQFHKVVYQWIDEILHSINTQTTINKIQRAFENDVFPFFCEYDENRDIVSSIPIKDITHAKLLYALKQKSISAKETARRLLANCNRIWIFAISNGYCEHNIIANISRDSLPQVKAKHYAKVTDEKILARLLKDIDSYKGHIITRTALKLLPYTMLRAENLTTLKWEYIDFKKRLLIIPRSNMKVKSENLDDFILPLTDKAIDILMEIKPITDWSKWVFHGLTNIHMHLNPATVNKALKTMGYDDETKGTKQTIHSFRGTFRSLVETYSNEHKSSFEVKESILDHQETNSVVRAYTHKADYTKQARELLEWWEQFLERVKYHV
ncbi:MAG: integrase arm-type DNA-binding domain-containing protein [Sulfurovaceae bacterium]|nr:integrase arm-type DNA-binding domain-containing protein [Sulfurovaceae bacterium]